MKRILFLTSTNLATNPRLIKEIFLAKELGYNFCVIQFNLMNWSDSESKIIEENFTHEPKFRFLNIDAIPNNKLKFLTLGILEKIAKLAFVLFRKNLFLNAIGHSKRSYQLLSSLKGVDFEPDFIVGHNLPALYPAYKFAKKSKIPFIFDVEDYHPGETVNSDILNEKARRNFLMKTMLPNAFALLSASPLIATHVTELIGTHKNHSVIINGFPKNEFKTISSDDLNPSSAVKEVNLVWFSQNINSGRGLEELLSALLLLNKDELTCSINLTLIGALNKDFEEKILGVAIKKFNNNKIKVNILPPMSQSDLHSSLSDYDVGLAIEFRSTDLNRNLCLTNKIVAYAQTGLYILATDTDAQINFISKNPELGKVIPQSIDGIYRGIKAICSTIEIIKDEKILRYKCSQRFSWDFEKTKIANIWKQI